MSISPAQMAYMLEGIDWRNSATDMAAEERGLSAATEAKKDMGSHAF